MGLTKIDHLLRKNKNLENLSYPSEAMEYSQAFTQYVLGFHCKSRALRWVDDGEDSISSPKSWGPITTGPSWDSLGLIQLCSHAGTLFCPQMSVYTPRKKSFQSSLLGLWQTSASPGTLTHSGGKGTVQVLEVCHSLLRSPAPGQNPMCDISDSTLRNYKVLPGRPHEEKLPVPCQTLMHHQYITIYWGEVQPRT